MIDERFARTELIFGEAGMQRLQSARVAVFGVGGVGGHLVQALARAGVGHITVIDDDVVSVSNINRQAVAMDSTVGRPKVEVIAEQVKDINPACEVVPLRMFYTPESAETLDLAQFDAIADCIDTVKAKVTLVCRAKEAGVYAISAMGAGNKLDPTRFQVADIAKTSVCPLCRVMRVQLKKRGVAHHTVVYSTEEPLKVVADEQQRPPCAGQRQLCAAGRRADYGGRNHQNHREGGSMMQGAVAREEVELSFKRYILEKTEAFAHEPMEDLYRVNLLGADARSI